MRHRFIILALLLFSCFFIKAENDKPVNISIEQVKDISQEEYDIDIADMIFAHIGDSYSWHITNIGHKHISIYLPIIIRSKQSGWHVFSSKHLAHNQSYKGFYIADKSSKYEGKIVEDIDGQQVKPFDISITKNVLSLFISALLLLFIVLSVARRYKTYDYVPKGLASFVEPIVMMVHNIAKENIPRDYNRYSPYLCTAFFFIFINNLLGIVPIFPGGANLTGNITITLVLAFCTFIAINFFANKHYYKELLWPDVPMFLKFPLPIMQIIEIFSALMKPISLMLRLFANILAGHILVLGIVSVIFIVVKYGAVLLGSMSVVSVLFGIFMDILELLVAFIQAYVFTILSAIFIGLSRVEEH